MSKKIYVSSVTYPLGDDNDTKRVPYLKQTILNSVLQDTDLTKSLITAYQTGRGIRLRQAYNYAKDHYHFGLPDTDYMYSGMPDRVSLAAVLESLHPGLEVYIATAFTAPPDFRWWAEQYLTKNYGYDREQKLFFYPPLGVEQSATVAYDVNMAGRITIMMVNADFSSRTESFEPQGLTTHVPYVHACYRTLERFPEETTKTTRPSIPGEVESNFSSTITVDRINETQETTTRIHAIPSNGTTTEITTKKIRILSRPQYFMYRLGSGVFLELDAWWKQTTVNTTSPYFPSLPCRLDNHTMNQVCGASWDNNTHPLRITGNKLMDKVGVKYDEILDKVNTTPQLKEIDFAFLVFGVELNTKIPEGQKYLFEFFKLMQAQSFYKKADFDLWAADKSYTPEVPVP